MGPKCATVFLLAALISFTCEDPPVLDPPTELRRCTVPAAPATDLAPPRGRYYAQHSDMRNSDEMVGVVGREYEIAWRSTTGAIVPGAVVFSEKYILLNALYPENASDRCAFMAIDKETGRRAWCDEKIKGAGAGPMVDRDGFVYTGGPGEVAKIDPETGRRVWTAALSALARTATPEFHFPLGWQPHPAGAIVGATLDGFVYAFDARTGRSLLAEPLLLPSDPPAPSDSLPFPKELFHNLLAQVASAATVDALIEVLVGSKFKIANTAAVDPATGRIWINGGARDTDDGKLDGLAEFGVMWGIDLIETSPGQFETKIACTTDLYEGGSAASPAVYADGSRIVTADGSQRMIVSDRNCKRVWQIACEDCSTVPSVFKPNQIVASVAVSRDDGMLYAMWGDTIVRVDDLGDRGEIVWRGEFDQGRIGAMMPTITENAIVVGSARSNGPLLADFGVALLDRETGSLIEDIPVPEDSIAIINVDSDGSIYWPMTPLRAAVAKKFGVSHDPSPVQGGIVRLRPRSLQSVLNAQLAASDSRARKALAELRLPGGECLASASDDIDAARTLLGQVATTVAANAPGTASYDEMLARAAATMLQLQEAEEALKSGKVPQAVQILDRYHSRPDPGGEAE